MNGLWIIIKVLRQRQIKISALNIYCKDCHTTLSVPSLFGHGALYRFFLVFYFYFYYITSQSLYSITRRIRISRLTTTPGSTTPTLYEQCVGSLTSHSINIGKDCETGPTVFRPYPRRLESLTICRCHYKGSTFFSVIVKTLSVGPAGA